MDRFQGYWCNQDPQAQTIARLLIAGDLVQAIDKDCGAVDDLGSVRAVPLFPDCGASASRNAAAFQVIYRSQTQDIRVLVTPLSSSQLRVDVIRHSLVDTTQWTWSESKFGLLQAVGAATDGILPAFPWPPPPASARATLPTDLAVGTNPSDNLNLCYARIKSALEHGGFSGSEFSVYSVPGQHGFVVVTKIENIDETGRFVPEPNRFTVEEPPPMVPRTLAEYLKALFSAPPGRFRFLALIVTDLVVTPGAAAPTPEQLKEYLHAGGTFLPQELGHQTLGPNRHCEAWIYEFTRQHDESARFEPSSHLSVQQHLIGTTAWKEADFR